MKRSGFGQASRRDEPHRSQRHSFESIKLNVGVDEEAGRKMLDLYGTMHGRRTRALDRDRTPRSYDVLIDAVLDRNQFESVSAMWLECQSELRDARMRFREHEFNDT